MLVYEGVKKAFIKECDEGQIADRIREKFIEKLHRKPGGPEYNSWKHSMQRMRGVLADEAIPEDVGIAIEYNVPPTGCRIDFLISGYDDTKNPETVIIELKQWEECKEAEKVNGIYKVNTWTGGGLRDVNHPSYQAMTYANLIRDYNQNVEEKEIGVRPCAFLHNYYFEENDPLTKEKYQEYIKEAPMFGNPDVVKLRDFIKKYIKTGDNKEVLYEIANGRIRPSKMLADSVANMLKGKEEFYMVDTQNIVYQYALKYANDAVKENKKIVMIVKGGPGTGKTVVAINLLSQYLNRKMNAFYITKNAEVRSVLGKKLHEDGYTKSTIGHLLQGSGSFYTIEANEIDCSLVDEAHRLTAKSGLFSNKGENQVKEIINASKFSVFFLDESQKVTIKDIGTEQEIRRYAEGLGAEIHEYELQSQFRCNGSDGYLAWIDNVLDIRETANLDFDGFDYEFKVFDDPNKLRVAIEEKNSINNKSRLVAGYCWNWDTEGRAKPNHYDIVIPEYDFKMSWNLQNDDSFAIGADTVKQVGCIHTTQGLEFDYVGVIIGNDMRYENERILTDASKRAKTDKSLFGIKKLEEEDPTKAQKLADEIIKNTYRTLMTRGMKGCYVYCEDKALAEYLKVRAGIHEDYKYDASDNRMLNSIQAADNIK